MPCVRGDGGTQKRYAAAQMQTQKKIAIHIQTPVEFAVKRSLKKLFSSQEGVLVQSATRAISAETIRSVIIQSKAKAMQILRVLIVGGYLAKQ